MLQRRKNLFVIVVFVASKSNSSGDIPNVPKDLKNISHNLYLYNFLSTINFISSFISDIKSHESNIFK